MRRKIGTALFFGCACAQLRQINPFMDAQGSLYGTTLWGGEPGEHNGRRRFQVSPVIQSRARSALLPVWRSLWQRYGAQTLSAAIGFWPSAILSSALFGFSHHGNSGEDWIGLFNAGAFGLLACFLLRRTGNLWMPIGLHMAFDWGETYFYGVADSGQTLPGHLLNSRSSGAALAVWWHGRS